MTKGHKLAPGPSEGVRWRSQGVTNPHHAPAPAHSGGHVGSQIRTRPQRQRIFCSHTRSHVRTRPQHQGILVVTKGHKFAPSPSASTSWRSQKVTHSHQAPATAYPGGHNKSQTRSKPQRQRVLAITSGHIPPPGPSDCVSWRSQKVANTHQAPAPAHSAGQAMSQTLPSPTASMSWR